MEFAELSDGTEIEIKLDSWGKLSEEGYFKIRTEDGKEIQLNGQQLAELCGLVDIVVSNSEEEKDIYCIECGIGIEEKSYQYHRTVANGDEYFCTNCKVYNVH